jgi:hypothetical protein
MVMFLIYCLSTGSFRIRVSAFHFILLAVPDASFRLGKEAVVTVGAIHAQAFVNLFFLVLVLPIRLGREPGLFFLFVIHSFADE